MDGLISLTFQCAGCGEPNDTTVDPTEGIRQSHVEDCQVCCQPNVLRIRVHDGTTAELESCEME